MGFDATYGYRLRDLLALTPPREPPGFADFWSARFRDSLRIDPRPSLGPSRLADARFRVADIAYRSSEEIIIRGWLLQPVACAPRCGLVLGHGYGGISEPPLDLPREDAVYLVPCFRGLGLSRHPSIPEDPRRHVLHDIDRRHRYVLGGCVDDLWSGVTALLGLFPDLQGHLGYLGISFGGGIGALAMAWDERIGRGHLNVPTFGHQALRLALPTIGSGAAVQEHFRAHGHVLETLVYYDAAVAAGHIHQPMHVAAALFDPAVAPPGQFAVYSAIPGEKQLFVLEAGHVEHAQGARQEQALMADLRAFFADL